MTEAADIQRRKSRRMLLLLLAIFVAPVAASWLLYLSADRLHLNTSNHGELIAPARALDTPALPLPLSGGNLPADFWRHRWTMVYAAKSPCDAACIAALGVTRDVRLDLTTHADDVQRLFLSYGTPADAKALRAAQPDLVVADVSVPAAASLLSEFDIGASHALDGRYLYLVDSRGYLMMRYPVDADPHGIIKDLQHLLGGGEM